MLVPRDGVELVKVLDFGIAAAVAREGGRATQPGIGIGTPEYMAPEQVYGADPTPRFDVYAIGVLLFEALTGTLPFTGDQASVILQRKATTPAPPITDHRPEIPVALAKLIDECLALDPEDRPGSADEIARVLESFVEDTPAPPRVVAKKRGGLLVTLGVAAAAAIVAVFAMRPATVKTSVPALARLGWVSDIDAKAPDEPSPPAAPIAVAPAPEPIAPVEPAVDIAKTSEPTSPRTSKKPRKDPALPTVAADPPTEAKPTPGEIVASDECVRMRARADDARAAADWDTVLSSTKRGACWKSNRDRIAMRVKALLELKRFAECKSAAGTIDDKDIQRDAKICEKRMTGP
jgi:serine/threonine-protein kinase